MICHKNIIFIFIICLRFHIYMFTFEWIHVYTHYLFRFIFAHVIWFQILQSSSNYKYNSHIWYQSFILNTICEIFADKLYGISSAYLFPIMKIKHVIVYSINGKNGYYVWYEIYDDISSFQKIRLLHVLDNNTIICE